MKKLIAFVALMVLGTAVAQATERTVKFAVDNMNCGTCPLTVRKAMQGVTGVKSVKVDYKAKTAVVVFDDTATTVDAIATASTNAGYPAQLATN